jgi:hypothetical protein
MTEPLHVLDCCSFSQVNRRSSWKFLLVCICFSRAKLDLYALLDINLGVRSSRHVE